MKQSDSAETSRKEDDKKPQSRIRKSLIFSFAERYLTILVQFSSSVIIARLLTPEEIGIFSVAALIVGLAHALRDFGVTNYLIQEKNLSPRKIRAAFTATLILAWCIALALFMSGPLLADFYEEPGMQQVTTVMALNFLLIPFGSPVLALLRRDMRFDRMFWINSSSASANAATSVGLAFFGTGFMSLAWGSFAGVLVTTIGATLARPKGVSLRPSFQGIRKVFRFGGAASAAALISEAGLGSAEVIAGKMLGFASAGFYSRGWGLVSLFNYAIGVAAGPVIHSAFASAHRSGRLSAEDYTKPLIYAAPIAWTFYGFAGFMAYPLLNLLYGDQWTPAAPIVQVLCIAFMLRAFTMFSGQAFLARGDVRNFLIIQLLLQPARIVFTIAAAMYSIIAVAWVQVAFYAATLFLTHSLLHINIGLTWNRFITELTPSAIIACISLIPSLVATAVLGFESITTTILILISILTAVVFFGIVHASGHVLGQELKSLLHKSKLAPWFNRRSGF